jgi:uncharacterized protein YdeI (YjbR/CyaY-like superfamily)
MARERRATEGITAQEITAEEIKAGLPILSFADGSELEAWILAHPDAPGLWLRIAKKGGGASSLGYAEALDAAICHGWIDGQKAPDDETWWLQRFTPRRPGGRWSKINCGKAEALLAAGRMHPRGQAEVDAARADGRWDAAYAGQADAEVPDDLQAALAASPAAARFFTTLSSTNRYAILYRIGAVKRAETRARKIAQYVAMLEAGETIHPQ